MNKLEGDGRIFVFPHDEFGFVIFYSGEILGIILNS